MPEPASQNWLANAQAAATASRGLSERQQLETEARAATSAPVRRGPRLGIGIVLGGVLLAAAGTGAFYFRGEATDLLSSFHKVDVPIERPQPERPQPPKRRVTIDVPVANLRSGPATNAAVVATLQRDTEVTILDRHGKWVLVRTNPADGTHWQEGWVYGSSLSDGGQ